MPGTTLAASKARNRLADMVSSVSDKAPVSTNASCPRTGSIKMARSPRVYS